MTAQQDTPPALPDTERDLLGALCTWPKDVALHVEAGLSVTLFQDERHRLIAAAAIEAHAAGLVPSIDEISARLREQGTLEAAGGLVFLSLFTEGVRLPAPNLAQHYRRLGDVAHARQVYYALTTHEAAARRLRQQIAADPLGAAQGALDYLREEMAQLESRVETGDGRGPRGVLVPTSIGVVLARLIDEMDAGPPKTVSTSYRLLDYHLSGGFSPGELIYLGARPGVGKTALSLEIARAAARRGPVLFISREMLLTALARRMIAQDGHIRARALKQVTLSTSDYERLQGSVQRLADLDLWLTDEAVTLAEIAALASRPPHGGTTWELVVVDYLQLVRAPKDVKERRLQVEAVSQGLKTLALQYRLPVLCLSSLRRPQMGNPRPTLADLRESGELEHDADVVMFLHRPDENASLVECNILKNRDGGLGRVNLRFMPEWVSFEEESERECAESA